MNRIGIIVTIAGLAILLGLAWYWNERLIRGLPPQEKCRSQEEAWAEANAWAHDHGGGVLPILGTGSMAPYIAAAPKGTDPETKVVAYAVTVGDAKFADIKETNLCTYHPTWNVKAHVMHQAAERDSDGWIMTGLHNSQFENRWRVTERNFTGIVARTFVWPL